MSSFNMSSRANQNNIHDYMDDERRAGGGSIGGRNNVEKIQRKRPRAPEREDKKNRPNRPNRPGKPLW